LPEPDGSLLVAGVRPGTWLLRIDPEGKLARQLDIDASADVLLNGHAIHNATGDPVHDGNRLCPGRGRIGVRDRATLKKLDEWESGGLEPHQLLLDANGHVVIANGGIPRNRADKKYDLQRMDSSLSAWTAAPASCSASGSWTTAASACATWRGARRRMASSGWASPCRPSTAMRPSATGRPYWPCWKATN
jgi:hypothetical protein